MKKLNIIICGLLLAWGSVTQAAVFCVYEANYPNVKDYNVRVDTTRLTIQPHGAYIEFDLEMTISYDFESWFFKNYNELEFLWQFKLPSQAIVDDFWIWVGDSILKPTIMDKWTAELLFSEVSSPVRNPGLLTQSFPDREGQVAHQLRLYPIMRNEKRKFKIHYLMPARPTNETLRTWLPISQLTSRQSPGSKSLQLFFKSMDKPTILGTTPSYQQFHADRATWELVIDLDYDQIVELVYPTPITDEFYFNAYQADDETFYQLAVYPPEVAEKRTPRKYLILVDFNRFNTNGLDGELVLLSMKETMQQALTEQDSASIIVSYEHLLYGADQFMACSEANLDGMFEHVMQRSFPAYSNFQPLFAAASAFLAGRSDSTDVIMFTNNDEIGLTEHTRETLAGQIINMFPLGTRIHMVDLDNMSRLYYSYYNDQYETQMFSFYALISYQTDGNLFFLHYHSIKNILAALFFEKVSHFQEVEVQTRFTTGYAYGKHFLGLHEGYYPLRFPIMQVGRYRGSLPLDVTVLGKVRMTKAINELTITDADVIPGSHYLATSWYGDHIHSLLREYQANATIVDIMDLSLEQNILTPYTGFLIFRPEDNNGYEPDDNGPGGNDDDKWATDLAEAPDDSAELAIELRAFPNPFNDRIQISLRLPAGAVVSNYSFIIYNSLGQQIRSFALDGLGGGIQHLTWLGMDDASNYVASGLYFAILTGPDVRQTIKLMYLK